MPQRGSTWRKSWAKENIFGRNGDGKCSKRQLSPDVRSVWDDYLDLAQLSPCRGKVCISEVIGYTNQQLSQILNVDEALIKKADKELSEKKMIKVEHNIKTITNWRKYQSEYDRQKHYRELHDELQHEVTTLGDTPDIRLKIKEYRKKFIDIYFQLKNWRICDATRSDYIRCNKVFNQLFPLINSKFDLLLDGLRWLNDDAYKNGYNWSVETLMKKWADFMAEVGSIPENMRKHLKK